MTRWLPRTAVELAEERVAGDAVPGQHPPGRAALGFGDHGHQQVLDGDVLVVQPPGLLLGLVEQRGQPRRDHDLARRGAAGAGRARDAPQLGLDVGGQPVHVGAHRVEQSRHQPVGLLEQREQQVLPSTSMWPARVAASCAAAMACWDFWVSRLRSIRRSAPRVASCAARCVRSASSSWLIRSSSSTTRPSAA